MPISKIPSKKKSQEQLLEKRLLEKGIDAFILALEVINSPTIKHRSENFAFNICNAWELVLKAQIVRDLGESRIYYKGSNARTISLQNCIDIIFSDFNNPIKSNIEIITKFRNLSTHFVTPEYDGMYITVFQANTLYFVEHVKSTFKRNLNKKLPSYFLTIATDPKDISDIRLLSKMDKKTFDHFLKVKKELTALKEQQGQTVSFEVRMKAVKQDADISFMIDKNADVSAQVINRILDPSNSHPFRQKDIINQVNKKFGRDTLNQYTARCVIYCEDFSKRQDYFYFHKQSNSKTYSQKAVDIIIKNIAEQPNYIEICIDKYKKK